MLNLIVSIGQDNSKKKKERKKTNTETNREDLKGIGVSTSKNEYF